MQFFVVLIFCGFVQSVPLKSPSEVPLFKFHDEIVTEDDRYHLEKKSILDQCPNVLQLEDNENFEQPSRIPLPILMTISNEDGPQDQDLDKIVSDMIYHPKGVMLTPEIEELLLVPTSPLIQPQSSLTWGNWKDEANYMQGSKHDGKRLPYELPPVTTQIHETLAEIDNYETRDDSDTDILSPTVRLIRSRDDELLEQLQHEAMMPNIIPTMPVPFVRTVETSSEYKPSQSAPLVILLPGKFSNCVLPFLLGCSTNSILEKIAQSQYGRYPVPPAVSKLEYREESDTAKSHEVNQV